MCGIAGVFYFDRARRVERQVFIDQTESLAHRGPDSGGVWLGPGAALGHRRLSIIDLSAGQQPLWSADGRCGVVFNGEIYNYRALRRQLILKGHSFSTESDTEVLLAAYREWGRACVERLQGMFAFCVYDRAAHKMFLARDRLGKKPLFYFLDRGRLIFGSELKAILLDPSVPRELEATAVLDYFAYGYVPAPGSILKDIYKLPAGFSLEVSAEGVKTERYWDPPIKPQDSSEPLPQAAAELLSTAKDAVGLRLRSDVPLGAFLSGGVDSSLIVALMSEAGAAPVKTHTIGFEEQAYDERSFARETAARYEAEHTEALVSPDAIQLADALPWFYDEPFSDSSAVPTYYLCGSTREQVTVALSGDGGDESFAGYRRYSFARREDWVRDHLPRRLRRALNPLADLYPKADYLPRYLRAKSTLKNLAVDHDRAYFLSLTQKTYPRFLKRGLLRELRDYDPYHHFERHLARCPTKDPLARMQYVDLKMYLCDDILVKVDRASMAHALEVRVPLLDPRIIEFAGRLPEAMKLDDAGGGKRVLKAAAGQLLPDSVLTRPKQGFVLPLPEWFRGPLAEPAQEVFFSQRGGASGLIRTEGLRRMWYEHQLRISNHATVLWSLFMFERWAERFLTRAPKIADAVRPRAVRPAVVVDDRS